MQEFEKEKIIWQAISKRIAFSYDRDGLYYCDVTTYFMTGNNLKYILAFLNSKLFEFALIKIYLEGDTFKSKNSIIQNFPIPIFNEKTGSEIVVLVDKILSYKDDPQFNIIPYQDRIDHLIYEMYDLSIDDIETIEKFIQ